MRAQGLTRRLLPGLAAALVAGSAAAQDVDATGTGWVLTRLDLGVRLDPGAERLTLSGDLVLRLKDHARFGPAVVVEQGRARHSCSHLTSASRMVMAA